MTIGLWVIFLIKCLTSTFLTIVKFLTHICYTTIFLSSVNPSIHHANPSSKAPLSAHTCLHRCCHFPRRNLLSEHLIRKIFDTRNWSNPFRTTTLIPLLDHEGGVPSRLPTLDKSNHTNELDTSLFSQNLKTVGL